MYCFAFLWAISVVLRWEGCLEVLGTPWIVIFKASTFMNVIPETMLANISSPPVLVKVNLSSIVCIYLSSLPWAECDTRSTFKKGWFEFSFLLDRLLNPVCPIYS